MTQLQQEILAAIHRVTKEAIPEDTIAQIESQKCTIKDVFDVRPNSLYLWDEIARILTDTDINLQAILDFINSLNVELQLIQLLNKMEWHGLLDVPGCIVNDNGVPALKLAYERYLSWFRGYSFQVSQTSTGHVSCGSSDTSLGMLSRISSELSTELYAALLYSYPVEASGRQDSFNKMELNNPEIIEEFMNETAKLDPYIPHNYTGSWVTNPLIQTSSSLEAIKDITLEIPVQTTYKTKTYMLGMLTLTDDSVTFDRALDGLRFSVNFGSQLGWDLDDYEDDKTYQISSTTRRFIQERLSILIIHRAGIWMNYMSCGIIPHSKIKGVPASPSKMAIRCGNDLYSFIDKINNPELEDNCARAEVTE